MSAKNWNVGMNFRLQRPVRGEKKEIAIKEAQATAPAIHYGMNEKYKSRKIRAQGRFLISQTRLEFRDLDCDP